MTWIISKILYPRFHSPCPCPHPPLHPPRSFSSTTSRHPPCPYILPIPILISIPVPIFPVLRPSCPSSLSPSKQSPSSLPLSSLSLSSNPPRLYPPPHPLVPILPVQISSLVNILVPIDVSIFPIVVPVLPVPSLFVPILVLTLPV